MESRFEFKISARTHEGQVREHNEDALSMDQEAGLLVLADGMGGALAGEVASALAVDVILHKLRQAVDRADGALSAQTIRRAVVAANRSIYRQAQIRPECAGMGTTVVVVVLQGQQALVAHVGDSRLYRLRGSQLEQITTDHSLVQEMVRSGVYTAEEARQSNHKNVVTRALGISDNVECDTSEQTLKHGDVFLLCSDGLNDMVEDAGIRDILLQNRNDLDVAAEALVDNANKEGGLDNVSVLLVRADQSRAGRRGLLGLVQSWFGSHA